MQGGANIEEDALALMAAQDSFAGIELLNRWPDPFAVMEAYARLVRHLYWHMKDLPGVVLVARAGIQHGLTIASVNEVEDPAGVARLRSGAKGLAYDLASFTWSGWDEPGIKLHPLDLQVGLDAAKANLRLARELHKGDLPLSRALWMLGAHLLAASRLEAAQTAFHDAAEAARSADADAEVCLYQGFERLCVLIPGAAADAADSDLTAILDRLAGLPNGPALTDQILTARRVFSKQPI